MPDQAILDPETKKRIGYDFQKLNQCAYSKGDDVCHNRAGVENPFCHWHTPKLNYIPSDPDKLSVTRSVQIINEVVNGITKPSEISDRDLKAIPVIMNIINSGSNIAVKEASLIDAQTKLNNAIKIIAGILQEEIKSAPLFERIINKIISVDLNETKESVKKKIKSAGPAPAIVDVTPIETPASVTPLADPVVTDPPLSLNTNTQPV